MAKFLPLKPAIPQPLTEIVSELRSGRLLSGLTTGLVVGLLGVIMGLSFAALIFSGDLAEFLPLGVGLILMGNVVLCTVVALLSSHPSSLAFSQSAPAAILASMVAATLAAMPAGTAVQQKLQPTILLMVGTTLLTGLLFVILGYFKLGGLVRFLPYPVTGGFLAGTGWLLLVGAISLMAGGLSGPALFQPETAARWLPGVALAILLLVTLRRSSQPLTMPAMFLAAIGLFYLIVWLTQTPLAQVSAQGWLLGEFPTGGIWRFPMTRAYLAQVELPVLAGNVGNVASILILSVVMLLLNVSGQELVVKQDIDLNRELVAAGIGNLVSGPFGALVGFHSIGFSSLNQKLSAGSRLTSLVTAGVCSLAILLGPLVLAFVPKVVLGGLLAFLGLSFLSEWVVQARTRFPRLEYGIILLIVSVVALFGFLQGVAVGLFVAVALFIINYSRINVVKHTLSGDTYQSRVTRAGRQRAILRERGTQIHILQLHGYLFFGTAHKLIEQVRERIHQADLPQVRFLVLDFRQVAGIDSTAMLSFAKMKDLAQAQQLTLVLTQLSPAVQNQFSESGIIGEASIARTFPDLDRGVEWCEEEILAADGAREETRSLLEQLTEILAEFARVKDFLVYLERQEMAPGAYLIRQGDPPDNIYFVESGQVTAQLEAADREPVRLETMQGGHVVGEIGFYLGVRRTAAVVVDRPSTVYRLSLEKLLEMEQSDPVAAATFHRIIANLLAGRVAHLVTAVDALLDFEVTASGRK